MLLTYEYRIYILYTNGLFGSNFNLKVSQISISPPNLYNAIPIRYDNRYDNKEVQ